jgi:hypothetical protein
MSGEIERDAAAFQPISLPQIRWQDAIQMRKLFPERGFAMV